MQARLVAAAGVALAALYVFVFLPGAYFRFDDFWQLNGSAVNSLPLGELLTTPNDADGRWNPGMRLVLWLIGLAAGVDRAWPFYLALIAAHAINVLLSVKIARALGIDERGRLATAFVGIAAVNLSAYSLTSIFLLHGVLAVLFALIAVLLAARYAGDRRPWRLVVCALATLGGLYCKEYAIGAPMLAAVAVWWVSRTSRIDLRLWVPLVIAFAAAGAAFAASYAWAGIPLFPDRGRYVVSLGSHVARNVMLTLAHVSVWLAIPAFMAWRHGSRPAALQASLFAAALVTVSALPTLILRWHSPGHLYLLLFATAVSAGQFVTAVPQSRLRAWIPWFAVAAIVATTVIAASAQRQILKWGPVTRQALSDWQAIRAPEEQRTIWFDAGNDQPYGGLARMIGPGLRLRAALELTSRAPVGESAICINLPVGPKYEWRPGDALYLHAGGRLTRIDKPPFDPAYCVP